MYHCTTKDAHDRLLSNCPYEKFDLERDMLNVLMNHCVDVSFALFVNRFLSHAKCTFQITYTKCIVAIMSHLIRSSASSNGLIFYFYVYSMVKLQNYNCNFYALGSCICLYCMIIQILEKVKV